MERPAGVAPGALACQDAGAGLAIETARPGDAAATAALDAVAWSDGAHPERIPDGEHVWRIWIDGAWVFVARERGALVGAIVAFPVLGGELFVHKVMVAAEYRRRGIGTRLFKTLLDEVDATSGAACFLTVDPAHAGDVRRYEALGFAEKEYVAGFYRDDEDRYVMRRPSATPSDAAPTSRAPGTHSALRGNRRAGPALPRA